MSANVQSIKPSRDIAIASLVLGIISIPTFGLLVIGGILGIILGLLALSKIKNNPLKYGGKGLAIAGVVTSTFSLLLIFVIGAIAIPKLSDAIKLGRQKAAIKSLGAISGAQKQYHLDKGRFGTLRELGEADLIDKSYAITAVIGPYIYTESEVSADTYCMHADRSSNNAARKDFVICEDEIIRYIESKTAGTVKRGDGQPLGGDDPDAPEAMPATVVPKM